MKLLSFLSFFAVFFIKCHVSALKKAGKHREEPAKAETKYKPLGTTLPSLGKSAFETIAEVLSGRSMTHTEIKQIYRTVDKNFDDSISGEEWGQFYKFFILPFERDCKPGEFYTADEKSFTDCLGNSPAFESLRKSLVIRKGEAELLAKDILGVLFSDLNFADFVLLQRAQEAWENCADTGLLGKLKIGCAFQITIAGYKLIQRQDVEPLFDFAIDLVRGRLKSPLYLDFPGFVNFAKLYSYYMEVDRPVFGGTLTKTEFRKGIEKRLFPIDITEIQLNKLLDLFPDEKMSVSSFLLIVHSTQMFGFYDSNDDHFLTQAEFLQLFNDSSIDNRLKLQVDKFIVPTVERIDQEMKKSSVAATQESFILNFLQMKSKKKSRLRMGKHKITIKKKAAEEPKILVSDPIENRKTMYNIFSSRNI